MDLLVLESLSDDPVMKQAVKGIAVITATRAAGGGQDPRMAQQFPGPPQPGMMTHVNTNASTSSSSTTRTQTATNLENQKDNERVMFPFRIKHLGKEDFTLYAPSQQSRQDWCDKI